MRRLLLRSDVHFGTAGTSAGSEAQEAIHRKWNFYFELIFTFKNAILFQECRYPNKKEPITNIKEMAKWRTLVNDVAAVEGKGKLKYGLVVTGKFAFEFICFFSLQIFFAFRYT